MNEVEMMLELARGTEPGFFHEAFAAMPADRDHWESEDDKARAGVEWTTWYQKYGVELLAGFGFYCVECQRRTTPEELVQTKYLKVCKECAARLGGEAPYYLSKYLKPGSIMEGR